MDDQCDQGNDSGEHRVPVEDTVVHSHAKVSPQRLEEIAVCVERNPTHHVAERSTKEDRQQNAGNRKDEVKGGSPNAVSKMATEFDSNSTEH